MFSLKQNEEEKKREVNKKKNLLAKSFKCVETVLTTAQQVRILSKIKTNIFFSSSLI
jgi:hypothetical protein